MNYQVQSVFITFLILIKLLKQFFCLLNYFRLNLIGYLNAKLAKLIFARMIIFDNTYSKISCIKFYQASIFSVTDVTRETRNVIDRSIN